MAKVKIPRVKRQTRSVRILEATYLEIAGGIREGETVVDFIKEAVTALARKRAKDPVKTE